MHLASRVLRSVDSRQPGREPRPGQRPQQQRLHPDRARDTKISRDCPPRGNPTLAERNAGRVNRWHGRR